MRHTTIRPADAADDMRRNYRREVRRHELRRKRRTSQAALAACIVVVVLVFSALALKRHEQLALPRAGFETAVASAPHATLTTKTPSAIGKLSAKKTPAKKKAATAKPKSAAKAKAPAKKVASTVATASLGGPVRVVHVAVGDGAFEPRSVVVSAGTSIVLDVAPAPDVKAAGFEMPALGVSSDNTSSSVSVHLGAPGKGDYPFRSGDGSLEGTLTVR